MSLSLPTFPQIPPEEEAVSGMNAPLVVIHRQLAPGERPVWEGQPLVFRRSLGGLWVTVFGLIFFGFSLLMTLLFSGGLSLVKNLFADFIPDMQDDVGAPFSALFTGSITLFSGVGILFCLVGLALILAPLWSAIGARRTFYTVTDRRALMIEGGLFGGMRVRSFAPSTLGQFDKFERSDGSGSLMFSSELYQDNMTVGTSLPSTRVNSVPTVQIRRIGFRDVPDVSAAEQALLEPHTTEVA